MAMDFVRDDQWSLNMFNRVKNEVRLKIGVSVELSGTMD